MPKICLGFNTNVQRPELLQTVREAVKSAEKKGFACAANSELSGILGIPDFQTNKPDVLLAFGGDGTILRAASDALEWNVPICGVNLGRIGFLSEVGKDEIELAYERICQDDYYIDEQIMLECRIDDRPSLNCLNDVLIYKESYSGVVCIDTHIDGVDAGTVYADGLIVSTPTGATGYSISAGGPVIAPGLDAAVITPVCPHTLSYRPIITSADAEIEIKTDNEANVAVDGNHAARINGSNTIYVTRAKQKLKFMRLNQRNLYALIKNKLS